MRNLEFNASFFSRWTFSWMDPIFKLGSALNNENFMEINEADKSEPHFHMYSIYKSMFPDRALYKYIFKTVKYLLYQQLLCGVFYALCSVLPSYMLHQLLQATSIPSHIFYLSLIVLSLIATSFLLNRTNYCGNKLVIRVYSILQSDIFVSTLQRKQFQLPQQGELLNFINIDVKIISEFIRISYYLISAPIQIVTCTLVLCNFLGVSGLLIIVVLILTVPVQKYIMSVVSRLQSKILFYTDSRISKTNELLVAIKLVKLNGWEDLFYNNIRDIRKLELMALCKFKWIMGTFDCIFGLIPILLPIMTLLIYLQYNPSLDPSIVFTMLSILQLVQFPIKDYPETALKYFEFRVSIERLQRYLNTDLDCNNSVINSDFIGFKQAKMGYVKPKTQLSAKDEINPDDFDFLLDVGFVIPTGRLTVVLGKTGCGKSMLLQSLCNQVPIYRGKVSIGNNKSVGMVPQIPWMMHKSIKDNIILNHPFEVNKYHAILELCCLIEDLNTFPSKDATIPQYCSGGQLQRIALARVLYAEHEMYLFDNVLASLDSITASIILKNVIINTLKETTRVLTATDAQLVLPFADYIVILKDGKSIVHGTLQQVQDKLAGFDKYLLNSSQPEANPEGQPEAKVQLLHTSPIKEKEEKMAGKINNSTYLFYISSIGGVFILFLIMFGDFALLILSFMRDMVLKHWSMGAVGDWLLMANSNSDINAYYTSTFLEITFIFIIINLIIQYFKVVMDIKGALYLHNTLLDKILHCELFLIGNVGTVLNRFSNDMLIVDKQMANSLFSVIFFIIMISSIMFFIMIYTPWFVVPCFLIIYVYYKLSFYYLNATRELKRLESSFRSPLMTMILTMFSGNKYIQVYGIEGYIKQDLLNRVDDCNNLFFQLSAANRWLSIRSDVIGGIIVLCSGLSLIGMDKGITGLIMTYSLQITNSLVWLLQHRGNLEINSCAIERIQEYVNIQQEPKLLKETEVRRDWPYNGSIKVNCLSVSVGDTVILKNLSLRIKGGHKIGIVGRTGAGKSTFLNSFFQLYQYSGEIFVDDVNLQELNRGLVRKRFCLIPQDPILFKGTVRQNLDLFGIYDDLQLYTILDKAQIKLNLDDLVEDNGNNKSVGERQLICLARCLLKSSRLVCIDEATASLDDHASSSIQKLMLNMKETTILCVAHKLKTIVGFDKIIVMNNGEIVEYNTPQVLINNPNSYFLQLAKESGDYEFIISHVTRILQR
eukprot:NODE_22_length_38364_cov_0.248661.p2 type:complete len:1222 gc:universal NODE_22_length_38364_cov_0.248661:18659-22324(+)